MKTETENRMLLYFILFVITYNKVLKLPTRFYTYSIASFKCVNKPEIYFATLKPFTCMSMSPHLHMARLEAGALLLLLLLLLGRLLRWLLLLLVLQKKVLN